MCLTANSLSNSKKSVQVSTTVETSNYLQTQDNLLFQVTKEFKSQRFSQLPARLGAGAPRMWRDLFTSSLDSASLDDGFIFRQAYSSTSSRLAPRPRAHPSPPPTTPFQEPGE